MCPDLSCRRRALKKKKHLKYSGLPLLDGAPPSTPCKPGGKIDLKFTSQCNNSHRISNSTQLSVFKSKSNATIFTELTPRPHTFKFRIEEPGGKPSQSGRQCWQGSARPECAAHAHRAPPRCLFSRPTPSCLFSTFAAPPWCCHFKLIATMEPMGWALKH